MDVLVAPLAQEREVVRIMVSAKAAVFQVVHFAARLPAALTLPRITFPHERLGLAELAGFLQPDRTLRQDARLAFRDRQHGVVNRHLAPVHQLFLQQPHIVKRGPLAGIGHDLDAIPGPL
jgi:hypothetical protein